MTPVWLVHIYISPLPSPAAARQAIRRAKAAQIQRTEMNRLSLLGMEMNQDRDAPIMASPAALGYGPALAMPTLMGMMPEMPSFSEGDSSQLDTSLTSALNFSPDGRQLYIAGAGVRDPTVGGEMPPSIANLFQNAGKGEGEGGEARQDHSGQQQQQQGETKQWMDFIVGF